MNAKNLLDIIYYNHARGLVIEPRERRYDWVLLDARCDLRSACAIFQDVYRRMNARERAAWRRRLKESTARQRAECWADFDRMPSLYPKPAWPRPTASAPAAVHLAA